MLREVAAAQKSSINVGYYFDDGGGEVGGVNGQLQKSLSEYQGGRWRDFPRADLFKIIICWDEKYTLDQKQV